MQKHYQPSLVIGFDNLEVKLSEYRPGQWFKLPSGARGQYLGSTHAGPCVNWVNGKFDKIHARANRPLRQYVKINSGK